MKYTLSFLLLFTGFFASAQLTEQQIDDVANRTLKAFDVPGIAIAIVKDGKIIHAKGYGVRSIETKKPVDANTLFGIASNSKAFTSAAIAMLVDEKKMDWDDKVTKYIPEFKMYNDYVTNEFTIRDLLTHRSGLGLGAGDLMIWPGGNKFTVQDIINNLQYLKPVSDFRTKYDYDNLLYIVAGEVVHRVSGISWQDFVEQRIMKPLEMNKSASSWHRLKDSSNVIVPHVPIDGKLEVINRYTNPVFDAAAGIYSSVNDLSKWAIMQLNDGKYGEQGKQLFSEKQHREMWSPQTILPNRTSPPYNSLFRAYGLGWQLADVNGKLEVSHTGGLEGIVTKVTLFPQLDLGIIVLTNQQSGAAFSAVTNAIKDGYIGVTSADYVSLYSKNVQSSEENADKITADIWNKVESNLKNKVKADAKQYVGTYKDNWFGEVTISEKKGKLYFASDRSPQLIGEMFFLKENNFVVKWNNRYFHADAHVLFEKDHQTFKMAAISPLTDFSYDFQDLDFHKVKM